MLKNKIFNISSSEEFEKLCLEVYQYQYQHNPVYQKFCKLLKKSPENVLSIREIPFLPIEFFKKENIITEEQKAEITFTSSGTTGAATSKHHVADLGIYEESFLKAFEAFYGCPEDYTFLALLPSYLERTGSSLIYMADALIKRSNKTDSGFYLNNLEDLSEILRKLDQAGKRVFLIGVSFALLDLVENETFDLQHTIVMETGGMKGRRKEMIREELHQILSSGFGVKYIHSEYGMTELLSQAYSNGNGVFKTPNWMNILIRDPEDALTYVQDGKTGGINVIDLANLNSCSFIATQDLGKISGEQIEIMGRFDNSDIRGCNLLVL